MPCERNHTSLLTADEAVILRAERRTKTLNCILIFIAGICVGIWVMPITYLVAGV